MKHLQHVSKIFEKNYVDINLLKKSLDPKICKKKNLHKHCQLRIYLANKHHPSVRPGIPALPKNISIFLSNLIRKSIKIREKDRFSCICFFFVYVRKGKVCNNPILLMVGVVRKIWI